MKDGSPALKGSISIEAVTPSYGRTMHVSTTQEAPYVFSVISSQFYGPATYDNKRWSFVRGQNIPSYVTLSQRGFLSVLPPQDAVLRRSRRGPTEPPSRVAGLDGSDHVELLAAAGLVGLELDPGWKALGGRLLERGEC